MTRVRDARNKTRAASWFSAAKTLIGRWRVRMPAAAALVCRHCGKDISTDAAYLEWRVCGYCGHHDRLDGRARIRQLVETGTFVEISTAQAPARSQRALSRPIYRARRLRQSVLTGIGQVGAGRAVIISFNFAHMGGTMDMQAGTSIACAFKAAAEEHLPVVAIIASGGVRIQEGVPALLQMAKTIQAVHAFRRVAKPYIAVLANPTTGGVYASFVSLADILLAEPSAVIGFAGPRVSELTLGEKLPNGSHNSEAALKNGMIDAVVDRRDLTAKLADILKVASARRLGENASNAARGVSVPGPVPLLPARLPDRPTSRDYISRLFPVFFEMHGDRVMGDDPTVIGGLAVLNGTGVVVIAQQRRREQAKERGSGPTGYRKAERLIRFADRLGLAILTFVDTPGADPGFEAERLGIAGAIANCLDALLHVEVPTISIITGDATSGGALALAASDRVLMLENAIYTPISPEGASAILFGDAGHITETIPILKMTTQDLVPAGVVDDVIGEPEGGAQSNADAMAGAILSAIERSLTYLVAQETSERLELRRKRYGKA